MQKASEYRAFQITASGGLLVPLQYEIENHSESTSKENEMLLGSRNTARIARSRNVVHQWQYPKRLVRNVRVWHP